MQIAFGIVNLFAGGGLQRDCVQFARLLVQQGHSVTIFTARREPGFAADLDVRVLPDEAWTNHGRNLTFARHFMAETKGRFDRVVGFDQLFGLDTLYCPHLSTAALLSRRPYLKIHPRYRAQLALERASFAPGGRTRILLLSLRQLEEFASVWNTEADRVVLLPPTVAPARRRPKLRADGTRDLMRRQLGLTDGEWAWLTVCAQPKTKGLDRTISALRIFPHARLLVAGLALADPKGHPFQRLAQRLDVADRISWLGFRDDVPELMAAADLLVHPARGDTTGTVILEAVINGLPVVTSTVCGYAPHVAAAPAGLVLPEPFEQSALLNALRTAEGEATRAAWSTKATVYGANPTLYEASRRVLEAILAPPLQQQH
jgi:UDP-glucose:(heptosyl)LPS alpha-1,3-glucosyltransferase